MAASSVPDGSASDHWTASKYTSAADFVHKLSSKVLTYLSHSPTDHILDIGCGDGKLTKQIAAVASSGHVHGLDSSTNFIAFAKETFPASKHPNLSFELQDCSNLQDFAARNVEKYDKVFSNAALHWILRDPSIRVSMLKDVFKMLKSGGCFVFEMGGAGNVSEVHTALIAGIVKAGVPIEQAKEASPWFFPSDVLMENMLKEAGFDVEKVELEYRPTKMEEGRGGGVRGWIELMGAAFLEKVEEGKRAAVVDEMLEILKPICTREEGGEWLGYVRCRAVARKP